MIIYLLPPFNSESVVAMSRSEAHKIWRPTCVVAMTKLVMGNLRKCFNLKNQKRNITAAILMNLSIISFLMLPSKDPLVMVNQKESPAIFTGGVRCVSYERIMRLKDVYVAEKPKHY